MLTHHYQHSNLRLDGVHGRQLVPDAQNSVGARP